jgi:TonB-linked SusC/RagA family outer membrane protein
MSVFLLWFSFSAFSEIDQTGKQKVTVIAKNETLESVFKQIEKQTRLRFMYATDAVDVNEMVSVEFEKVALDEVLQNMLRNKGVEWIYRGYTISLKRSNLKADPNIEENVITVTGQVLDNENNPIPGATVIVKGSKKGTKTDVNGTFVLVGVQLSTILEVRSIGFESKDIVVQSKNLTIRMNGIINKLDETIIKGGYYLDIQRYSAGNASSVKAIDISKQPISDPLLALQGRVPGMTITQTTGLSGGKINVQIRGINSIRSGTVPLFVVDGVPYQSNITAPFGGYGAIGTDFSALSFINPSDIESIDVLKDADATSIYGSRGANGVVLITTKKAKIGDTKINFSITSGLQSLSHKRRLLNTSEYLDMRREAFKNDNVIPDINNAPDLLLWDTTRSTDWQDVLIGGTAKYADIQATASGGNLTMQYLLGGNYHRETTIYPASFPSVRGGAHFNITGNSVDQRFKISLNGNYSISNNRYPGGDFANLIDLPPNAPSIYNNDGTLNWENSTWENPYSQLVSNILDAKTYNLITNIDISLRLFNGLVFKSNIGYNELRSNTFSGRTIAGQDPRFAETLRASASYTTNQVRSWISEPQLNYTKSVGRSNFNGLAGVTIMSNKTDGQYVYTGDILQDALIRYPAAANYYAVLGSGSLYKYLACYARAGYMYNDKYIANITVRRDGSSRFGANKRFATFSSFSGAWIFSEESFLKEKLPFLSFGKVRGSYGVTGNDQIGDYQYLDQYQFVDQPYQGSKGLRVIGLFNPDFVWELTRKTEFGLETGFLKDKILFSVSYYKTKSDNQLLSYTLPAMVGFSSVIGNLPVVINNSGIEVVLNTINLKTKNWAYSSSFNISFNRNKIVSDDLNVLGFDKRVGRSLAEKRIAHFVGVDSKTGLYTFSNGKDVVPGDQADGFQTSINLAPAFFGGINNSLEFKRVRLDLFFQFTRQKGMKGLFNESWLPGTMRNQPKEVLSRWRNTGDMTNIQRYNQDYLLGTDYRTYLNSDAYYGDASFIRCKNIVLSWAIPQDLSKDLRIKGLRAYVQAQNIFTVTRYSGWDPETQSVTSIPPMRVITFGAQMTL